MDNGTRHLIHKIGTSKLAFHSSLPAPQYWQDTARTGRGSWDTADNATHYRNPLDGLLPVNGEWVEIYTEVIA